MNDKIVYQGQNFIDKVLETTGSDENAFEMSLLNNVSITDDVIIGEELKVTPVTLKGIVRIFEQNNRPASGTLSAFEAGQDPGLSGIGNMIIENNFIVG